MKLKVVARAAKPPTVNIKPHGANLTLPANVEVYVLDTATNSTPLAFTIGVVGHQFLIRVSVFPPYYAMNVWHSFYNNNIPISLNSARRYGCYSISYI